MCVVVVVVVVVVFVVAISTIVEYDNLRLVHVIRHSTVSPAYKRLPMNRVNRFPN